jgi:hypothetical protein
MEQGSDADPSWPRPGADIRPDGVVGSSATDAEDRRPMGSSAGRVGVRAVVVPGDSMSLPPQLPLFPTLRLVTPGQPPASAHWLPVVSGYEQALTLCPLEDDDRDDLLACYRAARECAGLPALAPSAVPSSNRALSS